MQFLHLGDRPALLAVLCRNILGSRGTTALNFSLPFLLLPEVKNMVEVRVNVIDKQIFLVKCLLPKRL